jgi:hypothetical protein
VFRTHVIKAQLIIEEAQTAFFIACFNKEAFGHSRIIKSILIDHVNCELSTYIRKQINECILFTHSGNSIHSANSIHSGMNSFVRMLHTLHELKESCDHILIFLQCTRDNVVRNLFRINALILHSTVARLPIKRSVLITIRKGGQKTANL